MSIFSHVMALSEVLKMTNTLAIIMIVLFHILIVICIALITLLVIIYKIGRLNYQKAESLIDEAKQELKDNHNVIDFKIIHIAEKDIPMVIIRERENITEVKIPDDPEKIVNISQAISQIDNSEGTLSTAELDEIKKKLNN